jgi:protein TonB
MRRVSQPSQHTPPKTQPAAQTEADQPSAAAPAVSQDTAAASAATTSATASWQAALAAWLQAHKSYPEVARERHEEGIVSLRFVVTRDGRVSDVAVMHGSGVDVLDNAAFAMLRNARVPPLPATMPQSELTVTMALHYTLER